MLIVADKSGQLWGFVHDDKPLEIHAKYDRPNKTKLTVVALAVKSAIQSKIMERNR